jgi:hypothetical protein
MPNDRNYVARSISSVALQTFHASKIISRPLFKVLQYQQEFQKFTRTAPFSRYTSKKLASIIWTILETASAMLPLSFVLTLLNNSTDSSCHAYAFSLKQGDHDRGFFIAMIFIAVLVALGFAFGCMALDASEFRLWQENAVLKRRLTRLDRSYDFHSLDWLREFRILEAERMDLGKEG